MPDFALCDLPLNLTTYIQTRAEKILIRSCQKQADETPVSTPNLAEELGQSFKCCFYTLLALSLFLHILTKELWQHCDGPPQTKHGFQAEEIVSLDKLV